MKRFRFLPLVLVFAPLLRGLSAAEPPLATVIRESLEFSAAQYTKMLEQAAGQTGYPRTTDKGKVVYVRSADWTSGFPAGSLWFLAEATGDAKWRDAAAKFTAGLEKEKDNKRTHDLGFILNCSFGNGLRLGGEARYRDILLTGAASLASRLNPTVGCIRSWDHGDWKYPVIIDNMMNLEFLLWAAKAGNQPRFREIAIAHADTTLKNHFRPDGSSYHVIGYDPTTGAVTELHTHQGFAHESAWARGQAWGLYGYTMMYRETRDARYLAQAQKIAGFLLNHPRMPADKVPYWDFDAPGIPNVPRDASAAAIICSALYELSDYVDAGVGLRYRTFASAQLRSLASPAYRAKLGGNGCFLLMHCTGNMPKGSEIDVPLNYGDYYFLEALLRAKAHLGQ